MISNERLLLIDIGNHSIKAAVSRSGAIGRRWRCEQRGDDMTISALLDEAAPDAVAYCSVVPGLGTTLAKELERRNISPAIEITSAIRLPFELRIENTETLGADRIAAVAGAAALGRRQAVIVDAGTAVTVDVLSPEGFLGGSIFPGLDMLLRSLHTQTASLPPIDLDEDPPPTPGTDTAAAIASGVFWGWLGAIKELITRSREALIGDAPILITGGNAELLIPHLETPPTHTPELVFHGLALLFTLNK